MRMLGWRRVWRAITSVLDSFISKLYYWAHSIVVITSLCSSSLLQPKSIRSSAKRRWLILCATMGILTPQSSSSLRRRVSISGIILNHMGDDMPPYLTPFWIGNGRVSLLLTRSLLVPSCCSSANIATVCGFHPEFTRVSYSCGRLTESKAFFKSISQQYSRLPSHCWRSAIVSKMNT